MAFNLWKGDISKYIFKLVDNRLDMMVGLARASDMGNERNIKRYFRGEFHRIL